jgi:hypothetical protein
MVRYHNICLKLKPLAVCSFSFHGPFVCIFNTRPQILPRGLFLLTLQKILQLYRDWFLMLINLMQKVFYMKYRSQIVARIVWA